MFSGYWLVADMDGTLTPTPSKAHGAYLPLSQTATLRPLRRFLELGGSLCVVSTAGRRLWRQVYADLRDVITPNPRFPSPHRAQSGCLVLCGCCGASLFASNAVGEVSECVSYRQKAVQRVGGGLEKSRGPTTMDEAAVQLAQTECRAAVVRFFEFASLQCGADAEAAKAFFTSCLSRKYWEVYTRMLREMQEEATALSQSGSGHSGLCFEHTRPMRMEYLSTHGFFLTDTNDVIVDCQRVPNAMGTPLPAPSPAAQVTVLGIPMQYFDTIFPVHGEPMCSCASGQRVVGVWERLAEHELVVMPQPNSARVLRRGVDKGTCVQWLVENGGVMEKDKEEGTKEVFEFSLERALALGDAPMSVDKPLTEFMPMRFVSVAPKQEEDALRDDGILYVGGEEEGTACFLNVLLKRAEVDGQLAAEIFSENTLRACAQEAREALKKKNTI